MTGDLALLAERRAGLAALLGLLLLEEPGPELGELVHDVPALQPLAACGRDLAVEYARVLLHDVPLYESVFTSNDGACGGVAVGALVSRYCQVGFTEHLAGRWRVAGPDHLGLQLRCYALLCQREASSWRDGIADRAVEAVEAERAFLADHVAPWATVALDAARRCAAGGTYAPVLAAMAEFLDEELDRLRPAPDLGASGCADRGPAGCNLSASRLARLLLAPAVCGTWLDGEVLASAAGAIGAPWRPSDRRSTLRPLLVDAELSGDLPAVLQPIIAAVERATAHHRVQVGRVPGNAATAQRWAARSAAMGALLRNVGSTQTSRAAEPPCEHLSIRGSDPAALAEAVDAAVTALRRSGFTVEHFEDPAPG